MKQDSSGTMVSAAKAKMHLLRLSREGVGRRSVAAACDLSDNTVYSIRAGRSLMIRESTEKAILSVTPAAVADGTAIDAGPSMELVAKLLCRGFTKSKIAAEMGRETPALQVARHGRITARVAYEIERTYARLVGGVATAIHVAGGKP